MSGIMLTAGYDRAWHSVLIAESLRRAGHAPKSILLVYPVSLRRIRTTMRSRGLKAIFHYLLGKDRSSSDSLIVSSVKALGVTNPSLKAWAKENGVRLAIASSFNSKRALREARELENTVVVYSGGGIISKPFLKTVNGIVLNAHSGHLPQIRGMSALEWSLLLRQPLGVTIHLIDEGIDTGEVIEWIDVPPRFQDNLYTLRERLILSGSEGLIRWAKEALAKTPVTTIPKGKRQRQCFAVAPCMRELAVIRLQERLADLTEHDAAQ